MKNVTVVLTGIVLVLCLAGTAQAAGPGAKRIFTVDELQSAAIPGMDAQARERAFGYIQRARTAKANQSAAAAKVSPMLRAFAAQAEGNDQAQHPVFSIAAGQMNLKLKLAETDAASLDALRAAGLHVSASTPGSGAVYASCPVAGLHGALPVLGAIANVRSIEPLMGALRHQGSVLSEGDAALGANFAREQFGVDGSGVKVCVISDGTDGLIESAATGNVPVNDAGEPAVELCPLNDNAGAEGTAMLEIIHDLAPGAELAFCPAFGPNGEQGLADSITFLAEEAHCDVIVDDVAFLTEPYFEDGPVAQAVDNAFRRGAAYFSSAGNGAQDHYEAMYRDVAPDVELPLPVPANLHDFGATAGGETDVDWAGLVASGGNFFAAFLQWPDKFGESSNDYDLFLFDRFGFPAGAVDPDPTDDVAPIFPIGGNGVAPQDGDDDPLEIAFVVNNQDPVDPFGAIETFFIVVDRFAGEDRLLEINFNGFFSVNVPEDYSIPEGSIWGHAAARGAISVAATGAVANNDGTLNPGLDIIEPFSSRGPSKIFFDSRGRSRERSRLTPSLTATDGVSVTGFGGFPPTFFGTSASAPHAAAVAALALDARPLLGPIGVRVLLGITADDRGDRGFDATWGRGLINAERAVRLIAPRRPH